MTYWPSKTGKILILNPAANQLAGGHPGSKFKKNWIHSSLTFTISSVNIIILYTIQTIHNHKDDEDYNR